MLLNNGNKPASPQNEISPFIAVVKAIICQMKINKYQESIVQRGEIPRGMHILIDGEAQVVFDD